MGLIYKITNNVSGKSYIGQTKRELFERKAEHKYGYKNKDANMAIYHAFNKYGFDNFTFETIEDNIPGELLDDREIFYIKKFDTYYNGYNLTLGGKSSTDRVKQKIVSYNIYSKEILHFKSIAEAAKYFDIKIQSITGACNQRSIVVKEDLFFYAEDFNQKAIEDRLKQVRQRIKRRNERITFVNPLTKEQYHFKNPKEASKILKISGHSLRDALRGTTATTGGLIVFYTLDLDEETIETKIQKYKLHLFYKKNLIKLKTSVELIRGD